MDFKGDSVEGIRNNCEAIENGLIKTPNGVMLSEVYVADIKFLLKEIELNKIRIKQLEEVIETVFKLSDPKERDDK